MRGSGGGGNPPPSDWSESDWDPPPSDWSESDWSESDAAPRDSLGLLVAEDHTVRSLLDGLEHQTGPSVTEQAAYGQMGKELIQRIAVREAAKDDVVRALGQLPDARDLRQHMTGHAAERRSAIDQLDHMARHVAGMDLNRTQDFDGAVDRLRQIVQPEIEWELSGGAGAVRQALSITDTPLRSARSVRHRAPTSVPVEGTPWYERLPGVVWLTARWDQLQDYPTTIWGDRHDAP